MFVTCEVPLPLVLDLVEGGWLYRGDSDDLAKVGEALVRAAQHAIEGQLIGPKRTYRQASLEVSV